MSDIKNWSNSAAGNTSAAPDGAPEGMAPSGVNDTMREMMASVRREFEDITFFDWGDTPSNVNATRFKVTGDATGRYLANRAIRVVDATTLTGHVVSASYTTETTVTVSLSGSITADITAVALSIIDTTGGLPANTLNTSTAYSWSAAQFFHSTITASGNAVLAGGLHVDGATTLSGAAIISGALTGTSAHFDGDVTVSGSLTVAIDLHVHGDVSVSGTVAAAAFLAGGTALLPDGTGTVDQANLANSSVGQGELKTTTAVSAATSSAIYVDSSGGLYTFTFQAYTTDVSYAWTITRTGVNASYATRYYVNNDNFGLADTYIKFLYVTSSKPYDLGDGPIGGFIYVMLENGTGKVLGVNAADEATWHYNGPTITRADVYRNGIGYRKVRQIVAEMGGELAVKQEIDQAIATQDITRLDGLADRLNTDPIVELELTQAVKNADMNLLPHPYTGNNLTGKTVVLLDPVNTHRLMALKQVGVNLAEFIVDGKVKINNTPVNRAGPNGLPIHPFSF